MPLILRVVVADMVKVFGDVVEGGSPFKDVGDEDDEGLRRVDISTVGSEEGENKRQPITSYVICVACGSLG